MTRAAGLFSVPGFATTSEAFSMLDAGAHALKLFPAEAYSPAVLKAMRAVLPGDVALLPVGGIDVDSMASWYDGGPPDSAWVQHFTEPAMSLT